MTDKISNLIDLSPINSSKSDNSTSFFSPRELNLLPFTTNKNEKTRLSLNEKPSILLKKQPIIHENPEKSGFDRIFRANFLKDLEKKGFSLQKSKLSSHKSESSTFLPENSNVSMKKTQELTEELHKAEEREKEQVLFDY